MPAATKRKKDEQPPPDMTSDLLEELQKRGEEAELGDYLQELTGNFPIRVTLLRDKPEEWDGIDIKGTIENYDEPVSVEDIKAHHGGGKYRLVIKRQNKIGRYVYFTTRTVQIAGPPKTDSYRRPNGQTNGNGEPVSAVNQAMKLAVEQAERANARADRAAQEAQTRGNGAGPEFQFVMEELRALREDSKANEERLFEMANRKPEASAAERFFGDYIQGENARMEGLRASVNSELNARRETYKQEVDRLHARYEDIARRQEATHEREISTLKTAHENSIAMTRMGYDNQVKALEREITSLNRQIDMTQKELIELRARKERTTTEQLTEFAAIKTALDKFSGADTAEEKTSTVERIFSTIMESSLAEGIATRFATGGALPAQPAQAQAQNAAQEEIPFEQPVRLPDGRIIVRRRDGSIVELKTKKRVAVSDGEQQIQVDPSEVQIAVQFMEAALRNGTEPDAFAATARNVVPNQVLEALRIKGVDHFLTEVAQISESSPLATMHGKQWARKVASILIGGE